MIANAPLDEKLSRSHLAGMTALTLKPPATPLPGYAAACLSVGMSTLAGLVIAPRWGSSAVDLLYLPAVLGTAVLAGLGPALFAALCAALAYAYFFTAPRLTFRIDDPSDLVTVAVLFGVAVVTSQLAASVRRQARRAEANADRSATIANLAGRLLACASEAEAADTAVAELRAVFGCNVLLLTADKGTPRPAAGAPALLPLGPSDLAVAALVLDTGERAGRGVDRAVPTEWLFHPVRGTGGVVGVVGLARDDGGPAVRRDQLPLLDSLLDQLALALDRARLEREAQVHTRDRDRDRVRAALLSSIGQDLTPAVTAIGAAVAALRRAGDGDTATLGQLATETARVERYLGDLLDLDPGTDRPPLETGGISIDLFHRAVTRGGEPVHLAPREFAVLAELAKHPGRVLAHAHLLRTAWGPAQEAQVDYLRVAIRGLRQKLEQDPARPTLILNEPAVGYRLRVDG